MAERSALAQRWATECKAHLDTVSPYGGARKLRFYRLLLKHVSQTPRTAKRLLWLDLVHRIVRACCMSS